jgi:NAD(P)-dependent dehydrogenase (short-subunit alcohol dehydrogenase family)
MSNVNAGKVVIVTGGGSGIGRATALAFHASGAATAVADIDRDAAAATAALITAAGGQAIAIGVDVADPDSVRSMVAATVARFGGLDLAANCAGILTAPASTADCTEAEWDRTIAVNLKGVWLSMKYQIPELLKQGGGAIVNIASAAGLIAAPNFAAYTASKHGVVGLTRAAAVEYASRGIRINCLCPGFIRTPMVAPPSIESSPGLARQLAGEGYPIGRIGEPEEVADAVLWLCSPQSSFVLGAALPIDGGLTAL